LAAAIIPATPIKKKKEKKRKEKKGLSCLKGITNQNRPRSDSWEVKISQFLKELTVQMTGYVDDTEN